MNAYLVSPKLSLEENSIFKIVLRRKTRAHDHKSCEFMHLTNGFTVPLQRTGRWYFFLCHIVLHTVFVSMEIRREFYGHQELSF